MTLSGVIFLYYTPLRVSARDPRCARATSFLSGTMLRRLAPAALGACDAWRLRRLALAHLAPAALCARGAWRLRRLVPGPV